MGMFHYLVHTFAIFAAAARAQAPINVYLPDSPSNTFPNGTGIWPGIQHALKKMVDVVEGDRFRPEHFPHIFSEYAPAHGTDGYATIVKLLADEPRYIQQLAEIARLALSIHDVITKRPLLLLRQGEFRSVTLSQQEVAVLLASAFFGEFPKREPTATDFVRFPYPNFFGLFSDTGATTAEKLKCFFRYFDVMATRAGRPGTVLTFERRNLPPAEAPKWATSTRPLSTTVVKAQGTIEDDGRGMLQVEFANKVLGGGILGSGDGQEEIRFSINPELVASLLFTEELGDGEVLVMTGAERFSNYSGYASTFCYAGPYEDKVPLDPAGRRQTQVVAMDAIQFSEASKQTQFLMSNVERDLNKAYSGFMFRGPGAFNTSIATGKWGAGYFNGNPLAKFLIQLMAASEAERALHVFTHGDTVQEADWNRIYGQLMQAGTGANVGRVYQLFEAYSKRVETDGPNAEAFESFVGANI